MTTHLEAGSSRGSLLSLVTSRSLQEDREKVGFKKSTIMITRSCLQYMYVYLQQFQRVRWLHCCHRLQGLPVNKYKNIRTNSNREKQTKC